MKKIIKIVIIMLFMFIGINRVNAKVAYSCNNTFKINYKYLGIDIYKTQQLNYNVICDDDNCTEGTLIFSEKSPLLIEYIGTQLVIDFSNSVKFNGNDSGVGCPSNLYAAETEESAKKRVTIPYLLNHTTFFLDIVSATEFQKDGMSSDTKTIPDAEPYWALYKSTSEGNVYFESNDFFIEHYIKSFDNDPHLYNYNNTLANESLENNIVDYSTFNGIYMDFSNNTLDGIRYYFKDDKLSGNSFYGKITKILDHEMLKAKIASDEDYGKALKIINSFDKITELRERAATEFDGVETAIDNLNENSTDFCEKYRDIENKSGIYSTTQKYIRDNIETLKKLKENFSVVEKKSCEGEFAEDSLINNKIEKFTNNAVLTKETKAKICREIMNLVNIEDIEKAEQIIAKADIEKWDKEAKEAEKRNSAVVVKLNKLNASLEKKCSASALKAIEALEEAQRIKEENDQNYIDAYGEIKKASQISGKDVQTCEELIPEDIRKMIQEILDYVRIIVPILVIVLGMLDFGKAVLSSKEDEMKKSQMKFVKRLIIAVVVFFVPTILNIIFDIINQIEGIENVDNCGIK